MKPNKNAVIVLFILIIWFIGYAVLKAQYDPYIKTYSDLFNIPDWRLLKAQIAVESNFNASAVSVAGAKGLGQFIPSTWDYYAKGLDPFDAELNIMIMCKMMRSIYLGKQVSLCEPALFDRWYYSTKVYNGGFKWIHNINSNLVLSGKEKFTFSEAQDVQTKWWKQWGFRENAYIENFSYPLKIKKKYMKYQCGLE